MAEASRVPDIAVLGGDDPLGEAVLRLLAESDLALGRVYPLTLADGEGTVPYGEEELPVLPAGEFDWRLVPLVVLASRSPAATRQAEQALRAGCRIVGIWEEVELPVGLTRVPSAPAQALSRLARLLEAEVGLDGLDAFVQLPVSMAGRAAVEELSAQTRALFAMDSLEMEAFPMQIAFNLLPLFGPYDAGNADRLEAAIARDVVVDLGREGMPVLVSANWVPVFYGLAVSLHARSRDELDLGRLRAALAARAGITVMDEPVPGGVPTPATDALDSDDVFVGRIRVDGRSPRCCSLWLVMDGLRLEARRIVDSLENLIEISGNSMLT